MSAAWLLQSVALPGVTRPTVIAVAVAYFVVVAAIGAWSARRTRTAGDFFVAGREIGLWPLAIAAMASTLSGFAFIGGPGLVYSLGMGAMFIVLSASITSSMTAWVLAKRLRVLGEIRGLITVPDAIGARYRSPLAQGLSAAAILIAVIGYMATNILALGLVVDAIFGIGLTPAVWLGMLLTLSYSVMGGIRAGVYADVLQGSVMAVASVLVFLLALDVGGAGDGLAGISATLIAADPELLGPWGKLAPAAALSFFLVFGLGSIAQPHVVHKFYMLRDPRRLKWYPMLMSAALIVTLLLFFSVGVATKALAIRGEIPPLATPDYATPVFVLAYAPLLLAAFVFAGVAAAIMSTMNSFMSIGAAAVVHDLPKALGRAVADELVWGRVSMIVLSVAAALIAQLSGVLVAFLGIFGWGLFASTLVPALAVGLNWEGATRTGAIASIATGLALTLVLETTAYLGVYSFPQGLTVSGAALVASFLVFFVVSRVTRAEAVDVDADVLAAMRL